MHAAISLSLFFFDYIFYYILYTVFVCFFLHSSFSISFRFFVHKNYKRKQMKLFHSVCAQASLFIIHTYMSYIEINTKLAKI